MYSSGLDTGHENSGVAGSMLVPVQFVWPNGGRSVSLSGSFTRWSEHMPMSPSEGRPAVFQIICRLLPGHHQEGSAQFSEADLQLSRQRISLFLSTHTVYELLPDSGKVTALDVNLAVKQAFHVLYEQGLPMVPLWDDSKHRFVGILSALDFILILRELGTNGSNLTEEELETHTISAWKVGKLQLILNRQMDGNERPYPRRLVQGNGNANVLIRSLKCDS